MSALSERVTQSLAAQEACLTRALPALAEGGSRLAAALLRGNKLIALGCPEAAGHVAAEITGRLDCERAPLPAVSLSDNTAAPTAIANDYGPGQVCARQLAAAAKAGDFVLIFQLPGDAAARAAAAAAAKAGLETLTLEVPGAGTMVAVETFSVAGHLLCQAAEDEIRRARPELFPGGGR
jgi:D-sedoheptulose 7-phosphate isomerase